MTPELNEALLGLLAALIPIITAKIISIFVPDNKPGMRVVNVVAGNVGRAKNMPAAQKGPVFKVKARPFRRQPRGPAARRKAARGRT